MGDTQPRQWRRRGCGRVDWLIPKPGMREACGAIGAARPMERNTQTRYPSGRGWRRRTRGWSRGKRLLGRCWRRARSEQCGSTVTRGREQRRIPVKATRAANQIPLKGESAFAATPP
eukprot:2999466-Pyramimonas_sp.AAC.1